MEFMRRLSYRFDMAMRALTGRLDALPEIFRDWETRSAEYQANALEWGQKFKEVAESLDKARADLMMGEASHPEAQRHRVLQMQRANKWDALLLVGVRGDVLSVFSTFSDKDLAETIYANAYPVMVQNGLMRGNSGHVIH